MRLPFPPAKTTEILSSRFLCLRQSQTDKDGNQWKERGAGTVKFLKHKVTALLERIKDWFRELPCGSEVLDLNAELDKVKSLKVKLESQNRKLTEDLAAAELLAARIRDISIH